MDLERPTPKDVRLWAEECEVFRVPEPAALLYWLADLIEHKEIRGFSPEPRPDPRP